MLAVRTVIVGGGVGGLATAIRLSAAGHRLMPDGYRELFAVAGRRIKEYVDLVPMEPIYRIHFANDE